MTIDELRREALKLGYKLYKIPPFDCSCYMPYPNERKNYANRWVCKDRYEPIDYPQRSKYDPCTHCRKKVEDGEKCSNQDIR